MSYYRSLYLSLFAVLCSLMLCLAQYPLDSQQFPYRNYRLADRMSAQQHYARLLKKSSDVANPQWEDLGWAWGKRSARAPASALLAAKRDPDWHDLGWTWGRRK